MLRRALVLVVLASANACVQRKPAVTHQGETAIHSTLDSATLAPGMAAHARSFDRTDRLARAVIGQIRCAQRVAGLRRRGVFGPADSLGATGQCIVVAGKYVGVLFDTDTLFGAVSRASAVDLVSSTRRKGQLDTAAILAVARASSAAQLRGAEAYQRAQRAYSPVAFRFDGDSIEVWLIPTAVIGGPPLTVGGERGYVFSPDGRRLVREIDHFDRLRSFALPDTGVVRIPSGDHSVAMMTALLLANLLHERGRRVSIDTEGGSSVLAGEGDAAAWVHAKAFTRARGSR